MALPPLPLENQNPWYADRQAFDEAVRLEIEAIDPKVEAARWDKTATSLTAEADIYSLPAGTYRVGSTPVATALGLPNPSVGFLQVLPANNAGIIEWRPNRRFGAPETYVTQQLPAGEGWTGWAKVTVSQAELEALSSVVPNFGTIPNGSDLDDFRTMGRHVSPTTSPDIHTLLNRPTHNGVEAFRHFAVDVITVGTVTFQIATMYLDSGDMAQVQRRALGTVWTEWMPVGSGGPEPQPDGLATPLAALSILRAHLARVDASPVAIVHAGDSITIGTGATTPAGRYTSYVVASLQADYPAPGGVESTPQTSTTPTWTTHTVPGVHGYATGAGGMTAETYLNENRRAAIAALEPAMIVHAVGYNDYNANVDPAVYKANLESNLDQLDAAMPGHLAVHLLVHQMERPLSTPRTYGWVEYATAMQEIAQERGNVAYVDVEPEFTACDFTGADPLVLLDTDGIHPSDAGHRLLGGLIAAALPNDGMGQDDAAKDGTGIRDITSLATGVTEGKIEIIRVGNAVTLHLSGVKLSEPGAHALLTIPTGFRAVFETRGTTDGMFSINRPESAWRVTPANLDVRNYDPTAALEATMTYLTTQEWPATLPGTPA